MKKILFAAGVVLLTLNSCQKDFSDYVFTASAKPDQSNGDNVYKGPEVQMSNGKARTWISINKKGVPQEVAVEMTDAVFTNLPDTNFSVAIPFHIKAMQNTPFDHMFITWASHGHPLPGTFIGPHMDVRFYTISLEDQLAIPAPPNAGFDNHPPDGYMPTDYYADAPVAKIGLHWTDKSYANPPTNEMIYGTYDGKVAFISPIATVGIFKNGQNISTTYSQPQYFEKHSWYPTKYNVYMNTTTKHHYVTLSDFVWR